MNPYVDIGGSEVLTLKGALLVYRGRSRGFVAWHEVRRNTTGGAPFLGEAQEVTTGPSSLPRSGDRGSDGDPSRKRSCAYG